MNSDELVWGNFNPTIPKCSFLVTKPIEQNGVEVICNNKMAESLLGYNPVNDRLISMRLKGQHLVNTTVIQIDVPTSAADEENVDESYGKTQELVVQVPKGDISIIMGD